MGSPVIQMCPSCHGSGKKFEFIGYDFKSRSVYRQWSGCECCDGKGYLTRQDMARASLEVIARTDKAG